MAESTPQSPLTENQKLEIAVELWKHLRELHPELGHADQINVFALTFILAGGNLHWMACRLLGRILVEGRTLIEGPP